MPGVGHNRLLSWIKSITVGEVVIEFVGIKKIQIKIVRKNKIPKNV